MKRSAGMGSAATGSDAVMKPSKPVVVTRDESADGPLSSQLRDLGLSVLLWPAVATSPSETGQLDAELARIERFDWIVFASRPAVAAVIERLAVRPPALKVAAVGQATAQVLNQRGWSVDLLPEDSNAAALVAAFESQLPRPRRVLFPASSRALPTIAAGLSQLGAEVVQVEAYRTEPAPLDVDECRSWIAREAVGAVTFASPSAVVELERSLGKESFERLLGTAPAVAIGPTTARELANRGRSPVLAESATLQGLARTTHRLLQPGQANPARRT
ncbi:MAG TPA: uroporphyrinogen-III synthase [Steroidobacteraceae bacterium]|nr:uroporphyrinogen-III synthase [Steroidobacteraceae bacterium]